MPSSSSFSQLNPDNFPVWTTLGNLVGTLTVSGSEGEPWTALGSLGATLTLAEV